MGSFGSSDVQVIIDKDMWAVRDARFQVAEELRKPIEKSRPEFASPTTAPPSVGLDVPSVGLDVLSDIACAFLSASATV